MYPDPLRPVSTDVCHFYVKEWQKMGYEVLVVHYRSIFPRFYTMIASLFPKLAKWYIGNYVEMDRNTSVVEYNHDGVDVYSVPIYKFKPHGRFSKKELRKQISYLKGLLGKHEFDPDAIIGHFFNPQLEIVSELGKVYQKAQTCVVFHETDPSVVAGLYKDKSVELLNSIDILGFRSAPMRRDFENMYGTFKRSFICYSGTPPLFLDSPITKEKSFTNANLSKFIYVGQFTRNKSVQSIIDALKDIYKTNDDYNLVCIGSGGTCYADLVQVVKANHMEKHVDFVGQKKRDELIGFYDQSECFIMISLSEAFGLVYLEAMARGCICIGTRGQGIDGVIEDGKNGFLCEGGNSEELAGIIKRINAMTASEKKLLSDNAKETATRFSDYNVALRYIEAVMKS